MRQTYAHIGFSLAAALAVSGCSTTQQTQINANRTVNQVQVVQAAPVKPSPSSPRIKTLYETVRNGTDAVLYNQTTMRADCSTLGETKLIILQSPSHGMVAVANGSVRVELSPGNPQYACNGRWIPATRLRYRATAGYTGPDSVRLLSIPPTGGAATDAPLDVRVQITVD